MEIEIEQLFNHQDQASESGCNKFNDILIVDQGTDMPASSFSADCIWDRLRGAYAENTIRAYQADFQAFSIWCDQINFCALPTTPDTLAAFIAYEMKNILRPLYVDD